MQFSTVFLSLLAATAVAAKGNSTKHANDKSLCREMNFLEKLVSDSKNTTLLATKTKNNQTKIDDIVAKASKAAVQLSTMQSNTTLVSECAVINAADQTKMQCGQMDFLQKMIDTASNSTKLAAITKGNTTKESEIQAMAAKAQTKLTSLQSNTTLVDTCNTMKSQKAEAKAAKGDSDSTTSSAATASSSSSSSKSGAGLVSARLGSVVLAGLVGVGMCLL